MAPDTKINVMRQIIVENEQSVAKDSTQVIALFDRIMKLDQDDPQIPMLYAQYLLSKNMEPEAVPVLEQVVDLDPIGTLLLSGYCLSSGRADRQCVEYL